MKFEEIRDITREFVAGLEAIDPPDEAQALHDDSLEATRDLIEATNRLIADGEELESISDFDDVTFSEFFAAGARLDEICIDLQKLADDEAIDVDLGCDE